jgi:O-methyltransferase
MTSTPADPVALYLDLLKRSLTNSLFAREPDVSRKDSIRFWDDFLKHYIQAPAVSMLPLGRLDNLEHCIRSVVRDGVPGDLIETGVWRGGAVIFMRAALKVLGDEDRLVWAADSFEGLPEPDAEKFPREAKAFHGAVINKAMRRLEATLEDVQSNFAAYGLLDDRVRFLKGWFKDTLPGAPIGRLAVMRLDGDFYESTRDALVNLYDKLSVGGFCIIDDYGEDDWTYCKQAVDEFRAERGIDEPIVRVDAGCSYWRRSR